MRKGIYISTLLAALVASLIGAPAVAHQEPGSPTRPKPVQVKEAQLSPTQMPPALPASTDAYEVVNCYPSSTTWSTLAQTRSGGHYYSFVARTCLYWDNGVRRMKVKTMVRSRRDGDPWYAYSINGDTVVVRGATRPCSVCSSVEQVRTTGWADQGGTGRDFTSGPWCTAGTNWYHGNTENLRVAWTSSLVSNYHWHGSWITERGSLC